MADRNLELSILVRARDGASGIMRNIGKASQKASAVAVRAYKKMAASLLIVGRAARSVVGGMTKLAKGIVGLLTPGIGQLLVALGGLAVLAKLTTDAGRFSLAMAEVSTIVDTATVSMEAMERQTRDLARAQGASELVLAGALYQAISSGIDAGAKSMKFLESASRLAIAGVADVTATVDLLSGTMNAYRMGVESVERVSDIFFTTVRRGKTTIPELAGSMSQATPLAAQLGVKLEELASAVATITLSGTPTTEAITQVSAVMTALLKKADEVDKVFRRAGLRFDDTTVRTIGLVETLNILRTELGGSETALIQLLGRQEAMNATLNLTGRNLSTFASVMDDVTNSTGAVGVAFDKQMANPAKRALVIINSLRITFQEVGRQILVAIGQAQDLAGGLKAIQANAGIVAAVMGEMAATGVRALGRLLGVINDLVVSMGGAERVSGVLLQAVKLVTAAMRLGFETIVEAVTRLVKVIGLLPRALNEALAGLNVLGVQIGPKLRENVERDIDALRDTIKGNMQGLLVAMGQGLTKEAEALRATIKDQLAQVAALEEQLALAPVRGAASAQAQIERLMSQGSDSMAEAFANLEAQLAALMKQFEHKAERQGWDAGAAFMVAIGAGIAAEAARRATEIRSTLARVAETATDGLLDVQAAVLDRMETMRAKRDGVRSGQGGIGGSGLAAMVPQMHALIASFETLNRSMGGTANGMGAVVDTMERGGSVAAGMGNGLRMVGDAARQATGSFANFQLGQDIVLTAFDSLMFSVDRTVDALVFGTMSMGDAMKQMAKQMVADILKVVAKMLVLKAVSGILGSFGFSGGGVSGGFSAEPQATGGIMRGAVSGAVPLHRMAKGGIATGPSLAVMGENPRFKGEAFVPLPDGRSIPVQNLGGGDGGSRTEITYNITAMDSKDVQRVLIEERDTLNAITQGALQSSRGFRQSVRGRRGG